MRIIGSKAGARTKNVVTFATIAGLCVLAWAAPLAATELPSADTQAAPDLSGRWEGPTFAPEATQAECGDKPCKLTLDLTRCGDGWCGVEVKRTDNKCGATALKLDGGTVSESGARPYNGTLTLAKHSEPYVIEAYLVTYNDDAKSELQLVGDTGGTFRAFRRSFPFSATLVRAGEPQCKPESTVSLLQPLN